MNSIDNRPVNGSSLRSFCGIVPPLVTPLRDYDELDQAGLERLVEHVVGGGVHGLFILGSTGEGPVLSYRLRGELIQRTCRQVRERVPVFVGISDTSLAESLKVAAWAADAGAAAVVATPPYYLSASQKELQHYFVCLAARVPLPLLLYNMPAVTKTVIEPDTLQHCLENPRVVGVKDSSGSFTYLCQILQLRRQRPDWRVFVGDEASLGAAVQAGADGGVTGGANVFPKLFVKFYEAAAAGDLELSETLRVLVVRLSELYRIGGQPVVSGIKGIKQALSIQGICGDCLAEPFQRFTALEQSRAAAILDGLAADVASATQDAAAAKQKVSA